MRKKNQNLSARFESQTVQHNEKEKAKPFLTSNFKLQSSVNDLFQSIHPFKKKKKKRPIKTLRYRWILQNIKNCFES